MVNSFVFRSSDSLYAGFDGTQSEPPALTVDDANPILKQFKNYAKTLVATHKKYDEDISRFIGVPLRRDFKPKVIFVDTGPVGVYWNEQANELQMHVEHLRLSYIATVCPDIREAELGQSVLKALNGEELESPDTGLSFFDLFPSESDETPLNDQEPDHERTYASVDSLSDLDIARGMVLLRASLKKKPAGGAWSTFLTRDGANEWFHWVNITMSVAKTEERFSALLLFIIAHELGHAVIEKDTYTTQLEAEQDADRYAAFLLSLAFDSPVKSLMLQSQNQLDIGHKVLFQSPVFEHTWGKHLDQRQERLKEIGIITGKFEACSRYAWNVVEDRLWERTKRSWTGQTTIRKKHIRQYRKLLEFALRATPMITEIESLIEEAAFRYQRLPTREEVQTLIAGAGYDPTQFDYRCNENSSECQLVHVGLDGKARTNDDWRLGKVFLLGDSD
ncbi:ImmA/IrrE family metallo-endopeptidase [Poriferisphaera sp. WC338]|uniref:ImmA/IrrE family metallo-endopeptidase n=1 Tax=Poriferisphaera sp. WC338 TaxID=3425129 RepID=UPI003D816030